MRQRYQRHSTRKALATIGVCVLAMAGLIYWQWPFFEFWLILLLINF
jgi:chromate transport protein ChrA